MIPVVLKELTPGVVDSLFEQALVTYYKGEPYLQVLCRLSSLLREEFQRQIFDVVERRASDADKRARK